MNENEKIMIDNGKIMIDILSDDRLAEMYGNADFGPHYTPRGVIKETLLRYACGYHSVYTAQTICRKLGLIKAISIYDGATKSSVFTLTPEGKKYLYAAINMDLKILKSFIGIEEF